jgi:hypothetical protein
VKQQANKRGFMGLAIIVWLTACLQPASAVLLDWDNLNWTPGALTMTYTAATNASASTYVDTQYAGVGSVRITISGDTGTGNGFINTTPYVTNTPNGGFSSDVLRLHVDWDSDTGDSILVLVEFLGYASGVTNVNFGIYDIDRTGTGGNDDWTDQIRTIRATNISNTAIAATATNISPSAVQITNNSTLNLALTGTNVAGGDTTAGDAGLSFGTNAIKSFGFTWGNYSPATQSDPAAQLIGISDISFSPRPRVPEVHPGLVAVLACGLLMGSRVWRRFRQA